jgi:GT2 family glycosyltransferase
MSDVTVIIPVWNRRELLPEVIGGLRRQTHAAAEILVIDNGSEDGSAELAEELGARVIRIASNTGFSYAVNRGIEASRTEWLCILNNDVQPAPDWLEQLVAATQDPQIWFATGKILSASRPDRIDGTYDAICRGACPWRVGYGRMDGPVFSQRRPIWFASATAALYRAELFRRIGLLDERFESYLEDVDLGLRCALNNYGGVYVPEAVAYHEGSATLGRWHSEVVRRTARNQLMLIAKHYPRPLVARYAWSIVVAQGLWGLVALRHGAGWPFLRGKSAGLRSFKTIRGETVHPQKLATILDQGEREIREVQQRTGFDLYWRLYFLFTAGGAN